MRAASFARMDIRIICVDPNTTLTHAYHLMRDSSVRHLPVVDKGKLVGIISDRDLLLYGNQVSEAELNFPAHPISRIMSTNLVTARPGVSISQAAKLMLQHKVDSLPIVRDDGSLAGLVTSADFLQLASLSGEMGQLPFRFEVSTEGQRRAGAGATQDAR
jgi:acetoin utilization protein AcuB